MNRAHTFSTDGVAVTIRFNLKDGSEFGYVRADRLEQCPTGVLFLLGLDVVAGLGPLKLIIYRHDGTETSVDRGALADPPFAVSGGRSNVMSFPQRPVGPTRL